jgi:sporulation protein YlmC with PRC-barrel domain
MPEATQFKIGAEVSCADAACGELTRVVVDPAARAVTHVVVEPKHGSGVSRLVPVVLVHATADEIRLRCTVAEFAELEPAEETHYLPASDDYDGYGSGQGPYWGLGVGGLGGMGGVSPIVISDTVPPGEVDVRRGERVHATDGEIGRVQGVVVDPRDSRMTHVLLQEGHLWGRKEVAIPIALVTRVDEGIQLNLTKQQVQDLPPVQIQQLHL